MNLKFAKEVGYVRYIFRRLLWRLWPSRSVRLHTGVDFPTPGEKFFSSDVFVTDGNVDWNAEYLLAKYLLESGPAGDLLDIGAHIGYYSVLLSPCVERVFAFEPDARNHPHLQVALAGLGAAELIDAAVSDEVGVCSFSDSEESSVSHLTSGNSGRQVRTTTVDAFVESRQLRPSAIKIDIEGYDILALQGARGCARQFHPIFLAEYNQEENRPNSWALLDAFLRDTAYGVFVIHREDDGFWNYRYRFESVPVSRLETLNYKMIFLVPEEKRAWFDDFAARCGSWSSLEVRPQASRQLLQRGGSWG